MAPDAVSDELLIIDGSYGEGGGQVLRNSLALSMLSGRGIRIVNIRANRSKPGLRPQHLSALRGAVEISDARVEGDALGSREVVFIPGRVAGGEYTIDIGTAGSVTLLLQCLLPPLLMAEKRSTLTLMGGTDVSWSPPVDYLRSVLLPVLRSMGAKVECTLVRRGYYPKGGGIIRVDVEPSELTRLELEGRGTEYDGIGRIRGRVFLTDLPDHIIDRMVRSAEHELMSRLGEEIPVDIERCEESGIGIGTGITLWTGTGEGDFNGEIGSKGCVALGASMLGKRGVKAEAVGKEAAGELIREIEAGCGVDINLADQLPVFGPLVRSGRNAGDSGEKIGNNGRGMENRGGGKVTHGEGAPHGLHYTVREITPHLRTALWVLEQFGHPTSTLYRDGFHIFV